MSNVSIVRCPHDRENPYSMTSNALIRDDSLHPCVRWMLIYMLSMKDGWKITPRQIINHVKGHFGCGRDKVYEWIKEACDAGYMYKEEWYDKGLNRCRYLLSETPKFKKSLPRPDSQDPVESDPVNQEHKKEQKSFQDLKKDYNKEMSEVPKGPPTPQEAIEMADYLLKKREELFPKMKKPNMESWHKEIRLMKERDGRSWEEIRGAIDFAFEDSFWCRNILSASKLRKQYDKLYAKMAPVNNTGTQVETNRVLAIEIKNFLSSRNSRNNLQIYKTKCYIGEKNEELSYNMNPSIFEELLLKYYNLEKSDE